MRTQLKKNNFSIEAEHGSPDLKEVKIERPNIDHLIKKILVERRKEGRKNFLIFSVIVLMTFGLILYSFV